MKSYKDMPIEAQKKQQRWSNAYLKKTYDVVSFRVPKGGREQIARAAKASGMQTNQFLRQILSDKMKAMGFEFDSSIIFPKGSMK